MNPISVILLIVGCLCMLLAGAWYIYSRHVMEESMEKMDRMLDVAMNGQFLEQTFDESRFSLLETKMAHYLAALEVSNKNLADEKNKIKELIADISHQTKTPIANILLYTELMGEKELPLDVLDCVKQLQNQAGKLNFLIQSLVKTSRLEAGIIELHPKEQDVYPLIKEVLGQLRLKAKAKEIQLVCDAKETEETLAEYDLKWTVEALYNIVDNAVKYTAYGGKIILHIMQSELFVRIVVVDTGIGIQEEEHAQIFQRFYRSPAVSEEEGVGIGLFLARQIIAGEGGYIKLASQIGEGSTFSIYLKR